MITDRFNELSVEAEKRGVEIVLPLDNRGKKLCVRIEARSQVEKGTFKIIDYELVKKKERIDDAAERMIRRLRRDGIFA